MKPSKPPSKERIVKAPLDAFSGKHIPEWPMRLRVMKILEEFDAGKMTVPVAREELIYVIRLAPPRPPKRATSKT